MIAKMPINPSPHTAARLLAACFAIAIIILTIINKLTEAKISQSREQWLFENISAVLPTEPFDNNPISSKQTFTLDVSDAPRSIAVYTVYRDEQPAAAALEIIAPEGYSGNIKLLIGLQADGRIIGVRAIEHRETPGLGDKIEYRKSAWIKQFDQLSLSETQTSQWQLSRNGGQFDGLTGATVTSVAIVRAVRQALEWFERNNQKVFDNGLR